MILEYLRYDKDQDFLLFKMIRRFKTLRGNEILDFDIAVRFFLNFCNMFQSISHFVRISDFIIIFISIPTTRLGEVTVKR